MRVDLIRRRHVLRVHLRHHELAEQLHLLHLGERDFVADLNRLQPANRSLIPEFKGCSAVCSAPKFWAWACAEASAPLRVLSVVSTWPAGFGRRRSRGVVAGIELIELRCQTLKAIGEAFLLADQTAEVGEQILIGLPNAGAAAGGVFDQVPELLSQGGDGGGFLPKLLNCRANIVDRRQLVPPPNCASAKAGRSEENRRRPRRIKEPERFSIHYRSPLPDGLVRWRRRPTRHRLRALRSGAFDYAPEFFPMFRPLPVPLRGAIRGPVFAVLRTMPRASRMSSLEPAPINARAPAPSENWNNRRPSDET